MVQSAFTRPALRVLWYLQRIFAREGGGSRIYEIRGEERGEGERVTMNNVTKNTVHREESKDRPERREIPGILYRRRKTVSLKLRSVCSRLSSTAFFAFFLLPPPLYFFG